MESSGREYENSRIRGALGGGRPRRGSGRPGRPASRFRRRTGAWSGWPRRTDRFERDGVPRRTRPERASRRTTRSSVRDDATRRIRIAPRRAQRATRPGGPGVERTGTGRTVDSSRWSTGLPESERPSLPEWGSGPRSPGGEDGRAEGPDTRSWRRRQPPMTDSGSPFRFATCATIGPCFKDLEGNRVRKDRTRTTTCPRPAADIEHREEYPFEFVRRNVGTQVVHCTTLTAQRVRVFPAHRDAVEWGASTPSLTLIQSERAAWSHDSRRSPPPSQLPAPTALGTSPSQAPAFVSGEVEPKRELPRPGRATPAGRAV